MTDDRSSSKTAFLLIGLKQQLSKIQECCHYHLLRLQPWVLFSINTLPCTKSLHLLYLASITSVNFTVSARTLTSKQPALLPPPSLILNLTTVTFSVLTFQTVNLTGSNRFKTLLLVLLLTLLSSLISLSLSNLSTGLKVNERIALKLLSHLQSSYNCWTQLSSQPYLSAISSLYPLLICYYYFYY